MNLSITAIALLALFILPGVAFKIQYQRVFPRKKPEATEFVALSIFIGILITLFNLSLLIAAALSSSKVLKYLEDLSFDEFKALPPWPAILGSSILCLYVMWSSALAAIFAILFAEYTKAIRNEVCSTPWQLLFSEGNSEKYLRIYMKNNSVIDGFVEYTDYDSEQTKSADRDFILIRYSIYWLDETGKMSEPDNYNFDNGRILLNTSDCFSIEVLNMANYSNTETRQANELSKIDDSSKD